MITIDTPGRRSATRSRIVAAWSCDTCWANRKISVSPGLTMACSSGVIRMSPPIPPMSWHPWIGCTTRTLARCCAPRLRRPYSAGVRDRGVPPAHRSRHTAPASARGSLSGYTQRARHRRYPHAACVSVCAARRGVAAQSTCACVPLPVSPCMPRMCSTAAVPCPRGNRRAVSVDGTTGSAADSLRNLADRTEQEINDCT